EARFSVSRDLQEAMRRREIMESIPVEGKVQPWPENFPKVILQTTLASVKQKWGDLHARAKAGSREAALELVRNILGEERVGRKANPKWDKLRALAAAHPRAIVVPVHAEEATGRNKIPMTYARMMEKIAGLRVEPSIVQTVRANHTGANAVERMTRRAAFDGPVVRGGEYILVDDHVTQGGTLNELRKFIQSRGGKVVAATTLTASQFSDTMAISADAVKALYEKFGNNLDEELQQAGIANGVAELTQSQARELRKLRVDTLRDRLAQARRDRDLQLAGRAARHSVESRAVSGYTDLLPGFERFSTEAPRAKGLYPSLLNALSDDELISAGVGARIALGKSDRISDRSVKINTVQNLLRRLHPGWDTARMGLESQRVVMNAQKFAKRIRDDLDRGVSESLILEHLPESARETFGAEMRQEARRGARLGAFGARVKAAIEERQAKIVEDAVRVQTGIDADNIENAYGINLAETIMRLAEKGGEGADPIGDW
ncbi:MAG: phosphoribosyltransferase, partial [Kiritimatiellia bacterium]